MKTRRHHNNNGRRQLKTGSHMGQLKKLARKLGVTCKSREHGQ